MGILGYEVDRPPISGMAPSTLSKAFVSTKQPTACSEEGRTHVCCLQKGKQETYSFLLTVLSAPSLRFVERVLSARQIREGTKPTILYSLYKTAPQWLVSANSRCLMDAT